MDGVGARPVKQNPNRVGTLAAQAPCHRVGGVFHIGSDAHYAAAGGIGHAGIASRPIQNDRNRHRAGFRTLSDFA